jgi:magnesium transporter
MAPHRRIDVVLDSVKRLQRIGASANLLNLLQKQHPSDLAEVFGELTDKDCRGALNLLLDHNSRLAIQALVEYGPELGAGLLSDYPAEQVAVWLQALPPDDAVGLIDHLPVELSTVVLLQMRSQESDEVENLLEYTERTAGRIMNPTVFALSDKLTAGEAIQALQGSRKVEMVFYLYVVDERRHLVGVVSLRRLLLVAPETPLRRIMTTELISARVDMDQEEVARHVANYNLLAIPVVDEGNKLAGIITVDDVIDIIKDEATEDIYRLAGVSSDEHVFSTARESLRKRLPWLAVNLCTATLAAFVVRAFQATIDEVVVLAVLMTIVASMGGNAATQTLTIIVRGIALGELTWGNSRKAVFKEALVGLINGVALGMVGAGVAWFLSGNLIIGLILALAMAINLLVAAIAATLIPIGLRALKIDPALASAVFITTLTDVFGFFAFLGLATIFLPYLKEAI